MRLTPRDHDRSNAGLEYVYPVVSRRAAGVSIGINLNPNNACNWRCVYCQVPGLTFGNPPQIDLGQLERELSGLLEDVVHGDFMEQRVPAEARRLNDLAFSGNGEPTSSPQFAEAVALAGKVLEQFDLAGKLRLVLITNGTLVQRPAVQEGLRRMVPLAGEVWYKLDSATVEGQLRMNSSRAGPAGLERARSNLVLAASLCPTWVQTMVLDWRGSSLEGTERRAYLDLLASLVRECVPLRGVLLYGLARPSCQPEAPELAAVAPQHLLDLARAIEDLGLPVRVTP